MAEKQKPKIEKTKGLQVSKAVHRKLVLVCEREAKKINQYAEQLLHKALDEIISAKG
jgi:predicted HicB family RNase H-like nuclease